jgi:hypothetical protein
MTQLLYRCRACGEQFTRGAAAEFGYSLRRHAAGNALYAVHVCCENLQHGLADLIGERKPLEQNNA